MSYLGGVEAMQLPARVAELEQKELQPKENYNTIFLQATSVPHTCCARIT